MDKRFSIPYYLSLISVILAAGLRFWSLLTAVDRQGLPSMRLSVWVFFIAGAVYLIAALVLALRSPGRSGTYPVFHYGRAGFLCALASALLLGLGAVIEFAEALRNGPGAAAPIMVLLGLIACICCAVSAMARRQTGRRWPAAEVMPVVYLLVKLILNFKSWSTDPIILDYCVTLFALIFALLSFFRGAGFVFDQGKPRQTLFLAMGAVYFCAAAMVDGILSLSAATAAIYGGCLLWQMPMIWDLCASHAPDPKPEPEKPAK